MNNAFHPLPLGRGLLGYEVKRGKNIKKKGKTTKYVFNYERLYGKIFKKGTYTIVKKEVKKMENKKLQHFVVECKNSIEVKKDDKNSHEESWTANFKGKTPNSVYEASMTIKGELENKISDFNPESGKKYRLSLEEVKEE